MKDFSITDMIQAAAAVGALIVGIVTLRLVLVTLKAQLDLNRAQYDLLKIESNRAAREIRPVFVAKRINSSKSSASYAILCEKNIARDITIYSENVNLIHGAEFNSTFKSHSEKHLNPGNLLREYYIHKNGAETTEVYLIVSYEDEDGRAYAQRITLKFAEASYDTLDLVPSKIILTGYDD
ncbi:hypothetical protein ACFQZI_20710 [Mucilaginibacter lutimaris]|uniref:Uncharacterized protein n=1 Tax=Mucilaginibacter lutimaris TaxID=931629 RepID=A0ABW2ZLZ5_9SPHI